MQLQEAVQVPESNQSGRLVINVPVGNIIANPFQPRKTFDTDALRELADSILEHGILQPLLVVPLEGEMYLLIAGERRLRAAYIAQVDTVPVLLCNYSSQEVAEIAMIENLQREDLHFLDEAGGYELLMKEFSITQEALARRVGKKQSTVANKMRLLKLDKDVRELLRNNGLTERHARAVLRLDTAEWQKAALQAAADNELNVRQTEELVESFLAEPKTPLLPGGKRTSVIRDVRIFVNSIKKVIADVKKMGLKVFWEQKEIDNKIIITMKVPLKSASAKKRTRANSTRDKKNVSREIATENLGQERENQITPS